MGVCGIRRKKEYSWQKPEPQEKPDSFFKQDPAPASYKKALVEAF